MLNVKQHQGILNMLNVFTFLKILS